MTQYLIPCQTCGSFDLPAHPSPPGKHLQPSLPAPPRKLTRLPRVARFELSLELSHDSLDPRNLQEVFSSTLSRQPSIRRI